MVQLTLNRGTTQWIPNLSSYSMDLSVINTNGIPKEVFVMKRTKSYVSDQFDDSFAAVATPVQIEDFPVGAPGYGSSYYRTDKIQLVVRTAEGMQAVFDSMIYELNKLCIDVDAITNGLRNEAQYVISSNKPAYLANAIISSGGIADLTPLQLINIVEGSIVETNDGRTWVYTGEGSKLIESSYIQLGSVSNPAGGTNISVNSLYICNVG